MVAGKRDYGQFCGLAAGLNVVGERWTLLVVRELLISPARFNEMMDNLPGIGPNLLAERLRMLADAGVVEQLPVVGDGRGKLYQLTERGTELRAPLLALTGWGMAFLDEGDAEGVVRSKWAFLAIQAMVREDAVPDVHEVYEFRIGAEAFLVEVKEGAATFASGGAADPDLVVTGDPRTFVRLGARLVTPFIAIATGRVRIEGGPEAVQRCTRMLGWSEVARPDLPVSK
ncbi:winged helix-turn-helix transcriptional regulator [Saccharothrix isguenensis]